jgi:hypothetical protein
VVWIAAGEQRAALHFDPADNHPESAGESAARAVRSVLNTPDLGHPQLEAAVGVLGFALTPFAATYGAIRGAQAQLSPGQLSHLEQEVQQALAASSNPSLLRDAVGEIARQKTRRLLICTNASPAEAFAGVPVSARLEVTVEQLRLAAINPGAKGYALAVESRARLWRTSDGSTLLDRRYRFQSGPAPFVDWARLGGLESVAQTGYRSMAEEIATDIFEPRSEPTIFLGTGQPHARTSNRTRTGLSSTLIAQTCKPPAARTLLLPCTRCRLADHTPLARPVATKLRRQSHLGLEPPLQFVSFREEQPPETSVEIRTRSGRKSSSVSPTQPTTPADPDTLTDTEYRLDGLANDRNAVVYTASALAAVPFGLWEQTLGAVAKRGREKDEELARVLADRFPPSHLEGDLANELTRRLQSHNSSSARRVDEPLQFSLATLSTNGPAANPQDSLHPKSPAAIEIQVVRAQLAGKRPDSRSRALQVEIKATLVRTADGQELYTYPLQYRSASRKLKAWAAADAQLLRQELEACSRQAAEALAQALASRGLMQTNRPPPTPAPDQL